MERKILVPLAVVVSGLLGTVSGLMVSYKIDLNIANAKLAQAERELEIKATSKNPGEVFKPPVIVTVSAYTSITRCTDSTPWITASGTRCDSKTIALSRDLIQTYTDGAPFKYGDHVMLFKYYGDFTVEDTMNKRYKNRADLWKESEVEALRFGIDDGVFVVKL